MRPEEVAQGLYDALSQENRVRVSGDRVQVRDDVGNWVDIPEQSSDVINEQIILNRRVRRSPTVGGKFVFLYVVFGEEDIYNYVGGFRARSQTGEGRFFVGQINWETPNSVVGGFLSYDPVGIVTIPVGDIGAYEVPEAEIVLPIGYGLWAIGLNLMGVGYPSQLAYTPPLPFPRPPTHVQTAQYSFSGENTQLGLSYTSTGEASRTTSTFQWVRPDGLELNTSAGISALSFSASVSGTGRSVLLDSKNREIETAALSFTASTEFNFTSTPLASVTLPDHFWLIDPQITEHYLTAQLTGETMLLPDLKKPCSCSMYKAAYWKGATQSLSNTREADVLFNPISIASLIEMQTRVESNIYSSILVNSTRTQAIAFHLNGIANLNSKFYLVQKEDASSIEIELDTTPHFAFEVQADERVIPEAGSYTLQTNIYAPPLKAIASDQDGAKPPVGSNQALYVVYDEVNNPLFDSIVGTSIVWSTLYEEEALKCRKAFGTVTGYTSTESNVISSVTVSITRAFDSDFDSKASYSGTVYSNSGSIFDLLYHFSFQQNGTPDYSDFGFAPIADGGINGDFLLFYPVAQFLNYAPFQAEALGYTWKGDKLYIPNLPYINGERNTTEYAEVWVRSGGRWVKQDRPEKAQRKALIEQEEAIGTIVGSYFPG